LRGLGTRQELAERVDLAKLLGRHPPALATGFFFHHPHDGQGPTEAEKAQRQENPGDFSVLGGYARLTMFGISGEHLLVLGIVLLIFGPRRLPELGNTLGKAIRNFKDAVSGVEEAKFRRLEDEKKDEKKAAEKVAEAPIAAKTEEENKPT
jgi:sec-independent protein translocase protein TatA